MRFTPFSIKAQEFNKAVRGYDKEEVRVYLESLSNEFEKLQKENDELHSNIENSSEQIGEFQKLEKTLQATLVTAHESSNKAVESARKQNQLIIKEAEIKANQLVEKATKEAVLIRDSVLKLREEKNLLIAKLKAMIETQADLLNLDTKIVESIPIPEKKKVIADNSEINVESPRINVDKHEIDVDDSEIDVDDLLEKLL
jgi:cell division initiation protein